MLVIFRKDFSMTNFVQGAIMSIVQCVKSKSNPERREGEERRRGRGGKGGEKWAEGRGGEE